MAKPVRTLRLRPLMSGPEGWGTAAGLKIGQAARIRIDAVPGPDVVRLSLEGVARLDVTFAQEALVAPVRDYLGKRSLCVVDLRDADVTQNVAAAAEHMGVPVTLWSGATVQAVGLAVRAGSRVVLDHALQLPQTCRGMESESTDQPSPDTDGKAPLRGDKADQPAPGRKVTDERQPVPRASPMSRDEEEYERTVALREALYGFARDNIAEARIEDLPSARSKLIKDGVIVTRLWIEMRAHESIMLEQLGDRT